MLPADLSFAAAAGQPIDLTARLQDEGVNPAILQLIDNNDSNLDTQMEFPPFL